MTQGMKLPRRSFLLGAFVVLACSKRSAAARCETCGMQVNERDPFFAQLELPDHTRRSFDSPRCAFEALPRHGGATLWVREFYEQDLRRGSELRFVEHSDVVGPMGPDLVPVEPTRLTQFATGHGAGRVSSFDEAAGRFTATSR